MVTIPVPVGVKVSPPVIVRVTPKSEPVLAIRSVAGVAVPPVGSRLTVITRIPPLLLPCWPPSSALTKSSSPPWPLPPPLWLPEDGVKLTMPVAVHVPVETVTSRPVLDGVNRLKSPPPVSTPPRISPLPLSSIRSVPPVWLSWTKNR